MKRALSFLCAAAMLTASCHSGSKPADSPRVIVLGIDGGTWTVIEPMMEAGELPNLKKLYDGGLHGVLESRPPILSPVVWTTIFTGFGFMKHGVKDWKTSQSSNRRVSAIWEILRDQHKKVDVFNVPATWPPDPVDGVMLSGFPLSGATYSGNTGEVITREQLDSGKLPVAYRDSLAAVRENVTSLGEKKWSPWFSATVASRPSFRGTLRAYRFSQDEWFLTPVYRTDDGLLISEPKAARSEVSKKIGEPYIPEGPGWSRWEEERTPEVLYDHCEQIFSIQAKAAREYAGDDWNLFLYVMTFVDRISHPYWAYAHPEAFPTMDLAKAKKYENAVANAYRRTDEELGKILAKVKGDRYVVIVSDHGFQASSDATKAIGTHNPDGIYLVSGPGITSKTGEPRFIEDVTPTLLYLMNMPTGQDMDGRIFPDAVEMIGRKPASIPSYEKGNREGSDDPVDGDTWESLRGLGYVDGAPPRRGADKGKAAPGVKPDEPGASSVTPGRGAPRPLPKTPASGQVAPGSPETPMPNALEDWPETPPADKKSN